MCGRDHDPAALSVLRPARLDRARRRGARLGVPQRGLPGVRPADRPRTSPSGSSRPTRAPDRPSADREHGLAGERAARSGPERVVQPVPARAEADLHVQSPGRDEVEQHRQARAGVGLVAGGEVAADRRLLVAEEAREVDRRRLARAVAEDRGRCRPGRRARAPRRAPRPPTDSSTTSNGPSVSSTSATTVRAVAAQRVGALRRSRPRSRRRRRAPRAGPRCGRRRPTRP